MATIIEFSLAHRRDPQYRRQSETRGIVVPFPGVRYERLDNTDGAKNAAKSGKAAVSVSGKARYKPDF